MFHSPEPTFIFSCFQTGYVFFQTSLMDLRVQGDGVVEAPAVEEDPAASEGPFEEARETETLPLQGNLQGRGLEYRKCAASR